LEISEKKETSWRVKKIPKNSPFLGENMIGGEMKSQCQKPRYGRLGPKRKKQGEEDSAEGREGTYEGGLFRIFIGGKERRN